ncbi:MAG: signal peptidase I [Clostridia bacterium]|nr:signal peptidase I [Clostridia bacterium]
MAYLKLSREALLGIDKKEKFLFADILLICLLAITLSSVIIQTTWLSPVKVDGASMNVTLQDEDWLYMSKIKKPRVGDVVVFERSENVNYIKRIIALEGDTIRSKNGVIQIKKKGENVWKDFDDSHAYYSKMPYETIIENGREIKVGKGEMFVLGDNRHDSLDSRTIGLVSTDSILGIVPEWAIKYKEHYAPYLDFIEKVRNWLEELKKK